MMKRFLSTHTLSLALAVIALSVAASSAQAQRLVKLGISGGVAMPNGDLSDGFKTGYNVNLGLDVKPPALPVGFRVEALLNQLSGKEISEDGITLTVPDLRIIGGTANAVFQFPGVGIKPYLIGGVGMYNSKVDFDGAEGSTDFGINGGAGLKFSLGAFETYAEARLHNIFGDGDGSTRVIPISFGILF